MHVALANIILSNALDFRHRSQHAAVNPVADRLLTGLRRYGDLGNADDVSAPRYHVTRPHRTLHETANNHTAGLQEQLDAGRDPRRPHVLRRIHAEAGHRLRAQQSTGHHTVAAR